MLSRHLWQRWRRLKNRCRKVSFANKMLKSIEVYLRNNFQHFSGFLFFFSMFAQVHTIIFDANKDFSFHAFAGVVVATSRASSMGLGNFHGCALCMRL